MSGIALGGLAAVSESPDITESTMPRLVWFVLKDGRSMVAGCGSATKAMLENVLALPERTLAFTSDDAVEHIPNSAVREFVFFDARNAIPPATSIFRYVQV